MPISRSGKWYAKTGHKHVPWTQEETLLLSQGFLDADLEGQQLRRWLLSRGVDRTLGAIDQHLMKLNFFADTNTEFIPARPHGHGTLGPKWVLKEQGKLAVKALRQQIELARMEAEIGQAAPFKGGKLEY